MSLSIPFKLLARNGTTSCSQQQCSTSHGTIDSFYGLVGSRENGTKVERNRKKQRTQTRKVTFFTFKLSLGELASIYSVFMPRLIRIWFREVPKIHFFLLHQSLLLFPDMAGKANLRVCIIYVLFTVIPAHGLVQNYIVNKTQYFPLYR